MSDMDITRELEQLKDDQYRNFHKKLIPNIPEDRILGVRKPVIVRFAKRIKDRREATAFLSSLPHHYYDEDVLHAELINQIAKHPEEALFLIDRFLPYVDNWATSDMMNPKVLKNNLPLLHSYMQKWLDSGQTYMKRYGITTAMKYFLEPGTFSSLAQKKISEIEDEEDYYIRMAAAWYWAEALYKNEEQALEYFRNNAIAPWIRNKALQKARESRHFDAERKKYYKSLRLS